MEPTESYKRVYETIFLDQLKNQLGEAEYLLILALAKLEAVSPNSPVRDKIEEYFRRRLGVDEERLR